MVDGSITDRDDFDRRVLAHVGLIRHIGAAELRRKRDIDDFTQSVLLTVYATRERLRVDTLKGWIATVSRNRARTWNRSREGVLFDSLSDIPMPDAPADETLEDEERWSALIDALEKIPEKHAALLRAYYLDEQGYDDLQREHSLSYQALGTRLTRARQLLRKRVTHLLGILGLASQARHTRGFGQVPRGGHGMSVSLTVTTSLALLGAAIVGSFVTGLGSTAGRGLPGGNAVPVHTGRHTGPVAASGTRPTARDAAPDLAAVVAPSAWRPPVGLPIVRDDGSAARHAEAVALADPLAASELRETMPGPWAPSRGAAASMNAGSSVLGAPPAAGGPASAAAWNQLGHDDPPVVMAQADLDTHAVADATGAMDRSDHTTPAEEAQTAPAGLIAFVQQIGRGSGEGPASFLHIPRVKRSYENAWDRHAYDICTIRTDGTDRRLLTDDGWSRRPVWSWDGEWIAYVSGSEPQLEFCVMRADGSDRRVLLEREQAVLAYWWSHDSARVMVAVESRRSSPRPPRRRGADLLEGRVVDVATGHVARLSNSEWMRGWNHWEPGEADVVNPRIRLLEALEGVEWPLWSPDAEYIAFVNDGLLALAHVPTTGATGAWFLRNDEPAADRIHEWARSGSQILYSMRSEGGSYLVLAHRNGDRWGDAHLVTTRTTSSVALSPDAAYVAFTSVPSGRRNHEVYIVETTTGEEWQATTSRISHIELAWQPRP
jgi:RNA polymerase sigma factor (sigma-70 family)